MGWNIVVADDEAPAREELVYLLGQVEDVDKVALADGGMDAIRKVKELSPDVLFLDMEMPDLSGLQVARIVAEIDPRVKIVFSTAYDQYAVEAFKLRAFHYLLKPFDEDDLAMVFRELRQAAKAATAEVRAPAPAKLGSGCTVKLALEVEQGIKYVAPSDVCYISKEGKQVQVHTGEAGYGISMTLAELEQKLEPFGFFRCHKSYLVRLDAIAELQTWVNGAYNLRMQDAPGSIVPVSRNYVKELRFKLEI